jgi:hypothetical protein
MSLNRTILRAYIFFFFFVQRSAQQREVAHVGGRCRFSSALLSKSPNLEHDSARRMCMLSIGRASGRRSTPASTVHRPADSTLPRRVPSANSYARCGVAPPGYENTARRSGALSRSGDAHGLRSRHRFQSLGCVGCSAGCSNQGCSTGQRGSFFSPGLSL